MLIVFCPAGGVQQLWDRDPFLTDDRNRVSVTFSVKVHHMQRNVAFGITRN